MDPRPSDEIILSTSSTTTDNLIPDTSALIAEAVAANSNANTTVVPSTSQDDPLVLSDVPALPFEPMDLEPQKASSTDPSNEASSRFNVIDISSKITYQVDLNKTLLSEQRPTPKSKKTVAPKHPEPRSKTNSTNPNLKILSSLLTTSSPISGRKTRKLPRLKANDYYYAFAKQSSDHIFSEIPLMNSMVRYQLLKLLKARALTGDLLKDTEMRNQPVACLTAYFMKKRKAHESRMEQSSPLNSITGRIFYDNFLPIVCEQLSAVIHLDKFYCPGTHRPCVEFNDTIISPYDLLKKAGLTYTANWKSIFRVGNGKSIKILFEQKRINFKNHNLFCTGRCEVENLECPYSLKRFLGGDIIGDFTGQQGMKKLQN